MRIVAIIAALFFTLWPSHSEACSVLLRSKREVIPEVAAKGVLFRGKLIQAFDADKEMPEIFRAEEMFVGDGRPRDFVIYRSAKEYASIRSILARSQRDRRGGSCADLHIPPPFKAGQYLDRWTLMPAETVTADPAAKGRWIYSLEWGPRADEDSVKLLVDQAERLGRLKRRPPPPEEIVILR